jgi:hypothetical protein
VGGTTSLQGHPKHLVSHAHDLGFRLIVQRGTGSRTVVLWRSSLVEGLACLLPFGRDWRDVCSFHATQVLLSKLSKLLVAQIEHGSLLQEEFAMCLELIDLPFYPLALLS